MKERATFDTGGKSKIRRTKKQIFILSILSSRCLTALYDPTFQNLLSPKSYQSKSVACRGSALCLKTTFNLLPLPTSLERC
jgi:hypothetical protein